MQNITEITRRDIFDILMAGITLYETKVKYDYMDREIPYQEPYNVNMFYWGRLDEISFLKRLYKLNEIPSNDSRFENAERDILQRCLNELRPTNKILCTIMKNP